MEELLAALADKTRLSVIEVLSHSRASAGELADRLGVSPALLTRHLRTLREQEIVRVRLDPTDNRRHVYELNPEPLADVRDWAERIHSYWGSQLSAFTTHVRIQETKTPRNRPQKEKARARR